MRQSVRGQASLRGQEYNALRFVCSALILMKQGVVDLQEIPVAPPDGPGTRA